MNLNTNLNEYIDKKIENFNSNDLKNGCHYACSLINWINTFLLIIIIIILYKYLAKK